MKLSWRKTRHSTISLYDRHLELEYNGMAFRIPVEQIEEIHNPKNPLFRYFSYLKLKVDPHVFNGYMNFMQKSSINNLDKSKNQSRNITLGVRNPPEEVLDFMESLRDSKARAGSERMVEESQ